MLEQQGMAVVGVATNGGEALRQVRELRPDVALVDISLGAESGFDVGRQIAPLVRSVILISSQDEDDYAELIADSPAVGFLSKAKLSADAIQRLLTQPRPGSSRPASPRSPEALAIRKA